MKDGVVLVRDHTIGKPLMIDDEFLMSERNMLLFMIQPVPITISSTLSITVDFTAYNVSTLVNHLIPGARIKRADIRTYVLDSIVGGWQCASRNAFGSARKTSSVTGESWQLAQQV
jgi:hypothetical protein